MRNAPEHGSWQSMRQRCNNPKNTHYRYYGGSGVKVCDRWNASFAAFLADMGPRPSLTHSIDRWPDPAGNYEPGNCRWADKTQQVVNRRQMKTNTSGLVGVRFDGDCWRVRAMRYGKFIVSTTRTSLFEAACVIKSIEAQEARGELVTTKLKNRHRVGKSGFPGISRDRNRWAATIVGDGRVIYVGMRATIDSALSAQAVAIARLSMQA